MSRTIRVGRQEVTVRETLVDRVVGYFNPSAGVERLRSRFMLEAASVGGGYTGGKRDRRPTRNWRPPEGSGNADTLPDLPDLRARSRDLARNMPIATGAVATVTTNVVGEGLTVAPAIDRKVLGLTDEAAEEWESAAAKEWSLWCRCADFTRAQTFEEMQALAFRSALESGDVFALRRYRQDAGEVYGTKVHLVEADRVSNPARAADKEGMIGGVVFDGDGVATGYSIANRHPGDTMMSKGAMMTWQTAPARDEEGRPLVIHLFERLRPDLARGVPFLAPVIEALKVLGNYSESEATAALVASMFTVFVKSELGEDEQPIAGETVAGTKDELKLGPGAILDLAPGEDVQFASSNRPNSGFDAFVTAIFRQIGVALEIPYEILIKHFTASYSASRAALETAWQFFRRRRAWLAQRFCQPCYEWMLYEAVAAGRLTAPGFFTDPLIMAAWCRAIWRGPARISLDQAKDATADDLNLRNKLISREQVIQERFGGSFEATVAQLAEEERALDAAGLKPQPVAAPAAPAGPAPGGAAGGEDAAPPSSGGSDAEKADAA